MTFTPVGDGARTSTLSLSYNDGGAAQVAARAVTGTATTKALLNIYDWNGRERRPAVTGGNGPPFDFGVWGVAVDHQFTLRNDGGGPATMIGSAGSMGTGFAWKDGTYPGSGGDCGATLAVGATCTAGGHVHAQRRRDAVRPGARRLQRRRRDAHGDPRDDGNADRRAPT